MKKILKVVAAMVLVVILLGAGGMFFLSRGLADGKEIIIGKVNLLELSDGIYQGKYEGGRWTNEVKVMIEDHKIADIVIVEDVAFEKSEITEEIFTKVLQAQDINIDVVSGATVTSKAYLKAIEKALKGE